MMTWKFGFRAACLAVAAVLAACAASVQTSSASFVAAPGPEVSVSQRAEVQLPTGYARVLAEGSRWRKVGSVAQGDVYRPVGTVFTIEGRNVHEAYLIVTPQRALVGFYLPGEASASMLSVPVQLSMREMP